MKEFSWFSKRSYFLWTGAEQSYHLFYSLSNNKIKLTSRAVDFKNNNIRKQKREWKSHYIHLMKTI